MWQGDRPMQLEPEPAPNPYRVKINKLYKTQPKKTTTKPNS